VADTSTVDGSLPPTRERGQRRLMTFGTTI
jgi:hypothetical protein